VERDSLSCWRKLAPIICAEIHSLLSGSYRMRTQFLLMCFVSLCLVSALAAGQSSTPGANGSIDISVQREPGSEGEFYAVQASMIVEATPQRSWQVMTDYDHLASFVPGFTSSRMVTRVGNDGVLAQEGFVRFLFIKQSINLLLDVHEEPYSKVDLNLLQGNMRHYEAHWQLVPVDTLHTRILYNAKLAPTFFVPPIVGVTLMKSDLHKMLDAVSMRIEQRGHLLEPLVGPVQLPQGVAHP
jgi:ribosome-associated toxin RatA of RatAB toxin-antitoxin module